MPIHFRCAHCEKLLGIARRKAGTIVNCPQCGQPLIVPTPEEDPVELPADPGASTNHTEMRTAKGNPTTKPKRGPGETGKLFEQDDIDRLLDLSLNKQHHAGGETIPSRTMVPQQQRTSNGLPEPLPAPIPAPLPVIVPTAGGLSIGKILALLLIVFALVTGAFVAGLFVGKTAPGSVPARIGE